MCQLAIGRVLRICSRPYQEGDEKAYWEARSVLLDCAPIALGRVPDDHRPNWVRDRNRGAQGE